MLKYPSEMVLQDTKFFSSGDMGGNPMPIVTPPTVVQNAMEDFIAAFFTNPPQRDHVANSVTDLSEQNHRGNDKRTAECLRSVVFESPSKFHNNTHDRGGLGCAETNEERIKRLQQFDDMKFHDRGIIALDDVLLEKTGKHIKDSGTFGDHSEQRYVHAQDLMIINDVHPTSRKHYPLVPPAQQHVPPLQKGGAMCMDKRRVQEDDGAFHRTDQLVS
jgi:hypothetical protein